MPNTPDSDTGFQDDNGNSNSNQFSGNYTKIIIDFES